MSAPAEKPDTADVKENNGGRVVPEPAAIDSPAGDNTGAPEVSKKGAKKAEAKAKKEAEKARKAAEREAAEKAAAVQTEDAAKDNYGAYPLPTQKKLESPIVAIEDIPKHAENTSPIQIHAFLQNSRMQGAKMAFLELRERDWSIQAVLAVSGDTVSKQMVKWTGGISLESFIIVEALVKKPLEPVKSCRVSEFELHVQRVYLVEAAPEQLRLGFASAVQAPNRLSEEQESADVAAEGVTSTEGAPQAALATHLDNPAMHKRAPLSLAISKIKASVAQQFSSYLVSQGFLQFWSPSMIGAASEGGANVFEIKYFDRKAYLAQSPQFYKQIEIAGGRQRVFCIGPVFRAENSNTHRHMTEFIGLDMEMQIKENYHEVLKMLESVLLHIFRYIKENHAAELEIIRAAYPSEEFLLPEPGKEVRLTFAEGQALLRAEGGPEWANVSDDEDMSTPQERALGALIREKYKTDFYVLDKFPTDARPFYALPDPENPKVTNAYDFFMRGQEILSGGQRVNNAEQLVKMIQSKGVDPNQPGIKEYVDVFRSVGVPPHGGGGIGLDRVVAWYLNLPTVHLVSDYTRTPKRLGP